MVRNRRLARRQAITIAVAAAAVVVVVLTVLIAAGVLVLKSPSPAPVTISSVELHIIQGENASSSEPWFGPSYINYTTADGYPKQVAPGATWEIPWTFITFYNGTREIYSVGPANSTVNPDDSTFTAPSTVPALPAFIASTDHGYMEIYETAPSNRSGATLSLTLIVCALASCNG